MYLEQKETIAELLLAIFVALNFTSKNHFITNFKHIIDNISRKLNEYE